MVYIIIKFMVNDIPGFIDNFVERDQTRFEMGCLNYRLFHQDNNENIFTLLFEWKSKISYDKYFKDHVLQQVVKYADRYEDLQVIDLVTSSKAELTDSDFYVLSKFTIDHQINNPKALANEIEKNYPIDRLQKLQCESIEFFTNYSNINIVSTLSKWKDKSTYLNWSNSLMPHEINQDSDTFGKTFDSNDYQLKLIR